MKFIRFTWRSPFKKDKLETFYYLVIADIKEFTQQMPTIKEKFTVIIQKEDDGYVSLYPELDIASQGDTIEQAIDNLKEAIELFFECASPSEIKTRLKGELFITSLEVSVG